VVDVVVKTSSATGVTPATGDLPELLPSVERDEQRVAIHCVIRIS
jgi:hypothetical protein